jgi:hypothetical protein
MREHASRLRSSRTDGCTPSFNPSARSGQPLDNHTRVAFESRFAHDFTNVRVHTDARADSAARSADALAYAVGPDLVFRHGAFSPHTADGRKLLAHELAHVAEGHGDGAMHRKRLGGAGDDPAERHAEMAADRVTAKLPEIEALISRVKGNAALLRAGAVAGLDHDGEGPLIEADRFGVLTHGTVHLSETVLSSALSRAVAGLAPDGEGLLVEADRLCVLTQRTVDLSEIVQRNSLGGAVTGLALNRKGLLIRVDRLPVPAQRRV